MCAFDMRSKEKEGEGPVPKPTSFLTNSIELLKALDKRCEGCQRHVHLISGRAAAAQVYPKALCRAVVHGIIWQAQHDAADIMSIDCGGVAEVRAVETHPEEVEWRKYWIDISGQELDSALSGAARAEMVSEIHRMGVYDKVSIEECLRETGRMPIGTLVG